ncbi:MAG: redoxin domain-containing protein [Clostridia bacterium]|nr:redoxin domain-containing protein [Clostridia bacterium]
MKKTNRFIALLLAFALLLGAMMGTLTSCVTPDDPGEGPGNGPGPDPTPGQKINYTVSVKTAGGMPLKDVVVTVFADSTLDDLEGYAKTDASGIATVSLKQKDGYAVMLSGAPEGYAIADYYSFTGTSCAITLTSKVIDNPSLSGVRYELGSIMRDFTVRTVDGETVTLSELLKTKKAVMLNFWYTTCSWCIEEFPYLDAAYNTYSEDIAVVALDPLPTESEEMIKMFLAQNPLSFDVAKDNAGIGNAFGVSAFPTSVMIDRYGAVCLIVNGAITGAKYFNAIFNHFTAVDYQQKLLTSYEDLAPQAKPDITQAPSDEIASAIENESLGATYYPESGSNDAEYSWPFIVGEKDGKTVITTPIKEMDNAFATIHMDVELLAGEALMFDYFLSTELGADMLYVLVDGVSINTLSGESEEWESLCAYVAKETKAYKLTLIYLKDDSKDVGDDAVYITNMRKVGKDDVDVKTYIPRWAATKPNPNGLGYQSYETVVLGADGYYHVGSDTGPLLLANLMGVTPFSSNDSMYSIIYSAYQAGETAAGGFGEIAKLYDPMVKYCNYASNAKIGGVCTVDETLRGYLEMIAEAAGIEAGNPNQWLQFCLYYDAYFTDGEQLEDPIIGLAPHSAYPTIVNTESDPEDYFPNKVTYDRVLMPRGLWYAFTPEKSGAYFIASNADKNNTDINKSLNGWIFLKNGSLYYQYSINERILDDSNNVYMYAYFEAGTTYYIDIAYYDLYNFDSFAFKIEYLGESYEHFRAVSPGAPFTYLIDENGNITETLIPGGVKVWYDEANDCYKNILPDGTHGDSVIYADFTMITSIFSKNLKDMITAEAFNFAMSENDHLAKIYLSEYTDAELRALWGEEYDANYAFYKLADVKNGKYSGRGTDETATAQKYADMIIDDKTVINGEPAPSDLYGCVKVNKELATLLQKLMDKYTFEGVENSWVKLCYYYESLEAGWKFISDF